MTKTEYVYPLPPNFPERKVTHKNAKGTWTNRACAALTWHGEPCGLAAKYGDTLCFKHREMQDRGKPVKLQGGGELRPDPEKPAPVVNIFDGEELDLAGLDPSAEPLKPTERRKLAFLTLQHVAQHGSMTQRVKAAEMIAKYTPDEEKAAQEERDLDAEIFDLMDAISMEAGIEKPEPVDPVVQVRRLVAHFNQAQMDADLDWLQRQGVVEGYEEAS